MCATGLSDQAKLRMDRHYSAFARTTTACNALVAVSNFLNWSKQSFLREVSNTKALKHRSIVDFRDSDCSDGTFFFTLECCAHGSVDKLMQWRGGKLPVKEAMAILCDVLDGLEQLPSSDEVLAVHQSEFDEAELMLDRRSQARPIAHLMVFRPSRWRCVSGHRPRSFAHGHLLLPLVVLIAPTG